MDLLLMSNEVYAAFKMRRACCSHFAYKSSNCCKGNLYERAIKQLGLMSENNLCLLLGLTAFGLNISSAGLFRI